MNSSILSDLVITRVNSVSTLYNPEKTKTKRQDRKCWAIVIKYEGETVYESDSHRMISDVNHIVILPKGSTYEWECTKAGHVVIAEFESENSYHTPLLYTVKNGEKILKQFKDMESRRNLRGPMFEMESIKDLYSIILAVTIPTLEKYVPNSKQEKLKPVIEYIYKNIGGNITNDTLAAVAGMSTVYFRKTFTEIMGISPFTYAKQVRIEKAKEMLKSDYGTISDVAEALGYSSLYDFSRDFKKHTGAAPSKY